MAIAGTDVVGLQIQQLTCAQRMVLESYLDFLVRLEATDFDPDHSDTGIFQQATKMSLEVQELNTELEKYIDHDPDLESHIYAVDNTVEQYADRFWGWTRGKKYVPEVMHGPEEPEVKRELISTAQAMERYGRSRTTIYRWIKSGKLNAFKEGRRWVIEV